MYDNDPTCDWLDLQFLLRPSWQRFFSPHAEACRAAAAGPRQAEVEAGIDAAIRSHTRGGGWPPLSEHEARLLGARLHWAFCWITAQIGDAAESLFSIRADRDGEALCEWLLIDGWHQGGAAFLGRLAAS